MSGSTAIEVEGGQPVGPLRGVYAAPAMAEATWAVGQLRHLYKQMLSGSVRDTAQAARGLLGPAIEKLEPLTTPRSAPVTDAADSAGLPPEVLSVVERAAALSCVNEFEGECASAEGRCLPCDAARLLPPLRCKCGKFELNRARPSVWEMPVNHAPELCAEPPKRTHCSSCKQALP